MKKLNEALEVHYLKPGLYEDITARLKEQGISLQEVRRADIAAADEFHVRGAEVSLELASMVDIKNARVLDIGCGLGGPCRMLAEEFGCHSTGIDISSEFVRTATALSKLVGLDDKTSFMQADALNLPFEDNSFEVAWTQHVQMNIPDKQEFYKEIKRILKPGGHFLYYDIYRKNNKEVSYPMPWAGIANHSFLFKSYEMEEILSSLGLTKIQSTDQTTAGIAFFDALISRLKEQGPPKMGLNVLMGDSTKPKLMNLYTHLKEGVLELQSGVYRM